MNGKKWIKVFLSITLILGLTQYIVITFFTKTIIKEKFEASQTYSTAKWVLDYGVTPKYVFMGSSMSRYSIIPSQIAQKLNINKEDIANIGMDAATPYEMYLSYKKSEKAFDKVDTFFYTLEPWIFQRGYFMFKQFEKLLWSYEEWEYFSKKRNFSNNYFNKITLLLNSFSVSRSSISDDNGYKKLQCKKFEKYTQKEFLNLFSDDVNKDYGISEFQLSYLKKLKDEIVSKGSKFVITYVPNHFSYYEKNIKLNEDFNKLLESKLNNALGKTTQIGFFNPNSISLGDGDFMDNFHLCHSGAQKFSKYIANMIHNKRLFEPREISLAFHR